MKKAMIIIRTSTIAQDVEEQKKEVLQWVKTEGYKEKDIVIIGSSGASAIKLDDQYKENLRKAYETLDKEPIECVYAWALDRIGRNEEVLMRFKNHLISKSINLKLMNPSLSLLNKDKTVNGGMELAITLFATLAKQEMQNKKERFKMGKTRNQSEGRYNGGWMTYGYTTDSDGRFVVEESSADIVRLSFELYASGTYTFNSLSKELNARGYKISQAHLSKMLKDEAYIGSRNGKIYPRIVTDELFERVKEQRLNKLLHPRTNKRILFARHILKCPTCGGNYYASYDTYTCFKRMRGLCEAKPLSIKLEAMDEALWQTARLYELNTILRASTTDIKGYKSEIEVYEKKLEEIERKESLNSRKMTKLLDAYLDETITRKEYERRVGIIGQESVLLSSDRESYLKEIKRLEGLLTPSSIAYTLEDLEGLSKEKKKELIDKHIERAYLSRRAHKSREVTIIHIITKDNHERRYIYDYNGRGSRYAKAKVLFLENVGVKPLKIKRI